MLLTCSAFVQLGTKRLAAWCLVAITENLPLSPDTICLVLDFDWHTCALQIMLQSLILHQSVLSQRSKVTHASISLLISVIRVPSTPSL